MEAHGLMRRFILPPLLPLQFLDRLQHPPPDGRALHVARLQHGVGALGGLQGGVLAVLANQNGLAPVRRSRPAVRP